MDHLDTTPASRPTRGAGVSFWLLLACSIISIGVAALLCASLFARHSSLWIAVGGGLAVFPLVPLVWHGLAEAKGSVRAAAPFTGRTRLALRTLAVACVVLAVSLGNLGPKRLFEQAARLFAHPHVRAVPQQQAVAPPVTTFGLEPFIPADATLAVGLAGSTAMRQLFATHGFDTREKLAALDTCKIDFVNARILIAARGTGPHMIVVRAPGITEERNLYCLVGVMGTDRVQVGSDPGERGKLLQVNGWTARALTFRILDQSTLIATDQAWEATVAKKLLADGVDATPGSLAIPLRRVQLASPLWVASVNESPQGIWDLAIDSHQEGSSFKVQGSSTPPSGEKDRAEISASVPLAFAAALPERASALGARAVMTAIAATAASPLPSSAPP